MSRAGLLLSVLLAACGARSGLEAGGAPFTADAGPDATARPDDEPDRDCPSAPREGARCAIAPVPVTCEGCPAGTRICFYPDGPGLTGCTCDGGRWVCAPAACDGWGPDCTSSVRGDACTGGLGCGACCSLDGAAALATWCACEAGARPFCETDVVCSGP